MRRAHDLETKIPLLDFFPENPQLLLGQTIADTAVDTGAERQMLPRLYAVNDELVGALDLFLVAVSGDIPHHDLVALGDLAAGELDVIARGSAHVQHRRLIANDFGHQGRDQRVPGEI